MPAEMADDGFDLPTWLIEHGFDSLPVALSMFTTETDDAASGKSFFVVGVTIQDGLTQEDVTQCVAYTEGQAAMVAAEICQWLGPRKMVEAFEDAAKRRAEWMEREQLKRAETEQLRAQEPPVIRIPPSQEVVEQMIKDDQDRNKEGY